MKKFTLIALVASSMTIMSCDIEQTREGEMPEVTVDVNTEEGQLPEYDVDWMKVNVGTKTKTITIPTVQIAMEEKEVEVPFIDADWPEEYRDIDEQTIMVEAEVVDYVYDLEIEEIYAAGNHLHVISSLEKEDTSLRNEVMRVTDQVVVNAPDLTIKHYIIGDKPDRGFNNGYIYIDDKTEIEERIKSAVKIYG